MSNKLDVEMLNHKVHSLNAYKAQEHDRKAYTH